MNNPQKDLIFALDIGTRSVIGIVGRAQGEMFHVLYMAKQEHSRRAMVDGQIEDIDQVAKVVSIVKERLEEQVGHALTRVCVAAAGRSLRMERARAVVELSDIQTVTDELISQLEAVAIAEAEEKLSEHNKDQRFFLVGYTVAQYILDHYPMTTIKGHNGQTLEADVVATFLPSQVVEGLYSVVQMAGMEVASLTLEPIAALNATIPPDLRLLNLVLVDIGAGTSDIAVCRDGSVVGYTMATTAGDEITEMLMKHFLVDFATAEGLKTNLNAGDLKYTDVLGIEHKTSGQEISDNVSVASKTLVKEIAKQIHAINGCAPSAVFMAGGGSKLEGITQMLAETLELQPHRIAVAGNNFGRTVVAENFEMEDPEYATPLGIAVSAALGLINDSYHITLNGKGAKLFRSGSLTILDILMMNGYTAAALIGRTGKNLAIMINGNKKIIRGKPSIPGILRLNGDPTVAGALVSAGDNIEFVPAIDGLSATSTLQELLGDYSGHVLLNGGEVPWDTQLKSGDSITTVTTPMQYSRKPRALSPEEIRPVENNMGQDSFYAPEESESPLGSAQFSMGSSIPEPEEDQEPMELPSLDDEDMKIYGSQETSTETLSEEKEESMLSSVPEEPEESEEPEEISSKMELPPPVESPEKEPLKKAREYPASEEVAIPMPPTEMYKPIPVDALTGMSDKIAPIHPISPEEEPEIETTYMENAAVKSPVEPPAMVANPVQPAPVVAPPMVENPVANMPKIVPPLTANPVVAVETANDTSEEESLVAERHFEPIPVEPRSNQEAELPPVIRMSEEVEQAAMHALGDSEEESSLDLEALQENLEREIERATAKQEASIAQSRNVGGFSSNDLDMLTGGGTAQKETAPSQTLEEISSDLPPLTEGSIVLNGVPIQLAPKGDGSPYYLMDLLDKTDIDFRNVTNPINMLVNGKVAFFVQHIHANDNVLIEEQTKPKS